MQFPYDALPDEIRSIFEEMQQTVDPDAIDALTESLRAIDHSIVIIKTKGLLASNDPDVRCLAVRVLLLYDVKATLEFVLPLLQDTVDYVRLCVCEELADNGCHDNRAVEPVINILRNDPVSDNRASAATLLGVIGSTEAIPDLQFSAENDFGLDFEGETISSSAKWAIKTIRWKNNEKVI